MAKKKKLETILQEHSVQEAARSVSEAKSLYYSRLKQADSTRVIEPYCIPHVEGKAGSTIMIVDLKDSYLAKDFDFYHHSFEEVLAFAVEERGDWELHLCAMDGLYLTEYPAPNESGVAYMVSTNGQHRRLVFQSIGFPKAKAIVQESAGSEWRYFWRGRNVAAEKILIWFRELGLIDQVSELDRYTLLIEGKDHLAAWILPNPSSGSLTKMLKEMNHRLTLIEKAFGPLHHDSIPIIRSRFRSLLSIQLAYYKRGNWE